MATDRPRTWIQVFTERRSQYISYSDLLHSMLPFSGAGIAGTAEVLLSQKAERNAGYMPAAIRHENEERAKLDVFFTAIFTGNRRCKAKSKGHAYVS